MLYLCGKITITLSRKWDFHINHLINFYSFSNTIALHEKNNSLHLKVLTLLHYVLLWKVIYEGIDIITLCFIVGGHI